MTLAVMRGHVVARAWYVCDGRHLGLERGGCTQNTLRAEQARPVDLLDLYMGADLVATA